MINVPNMTKEQYEGYNNSQYLPDECKDAMRKLNAKNKWGITDRALERLKQQHKSARKKGQYGMMAMIEYRLTDINFHTECSLWYNGVYT